MSSRGPHVCPRCGEPVSAFAAGCALCGADLDPRRAQGPPGAPQRLRSVWRARPRLFPRIGLPDRRR
jgi:predicted amidophosphoribosyltransferase